MPRFDEETARSAVEIQHVVLDWGYDLDINGGTGVPALCTDDVNYLLGGTPYRGPEAVGGFYAARNERVRTLQKDGVRTQRHTVCNIRVSFKTKDEAEATFMVVNYSKEGKPPALDLVGPTIVADSRMEFLRGADGEWRISLFDSTPVFVGNDPFLNASVVKK